METEIQLPWIRELRKKAKMNFDSMQLPKEREEAWRYTDLNKLSLSFQSSDTSSVSIECDNDKVTATNLAVAMQGHDDINDIIKDHLGKLLGKHDDKITAFHLANFSDGVFIHVPKNEKAEVSAIFEDSSVHNIIIVEEGAQLIYSEDFVGSFSGMLTDVSEVFVKENSQAEFNSLQDYGTQTKAFSIKNAQLGKNATLNWTFGAFGSAFHRLHSSTFFQGEGANAETLAASLSRGSQHIDITTNAHHEVPHTSNNILAKGVLLDESTSVYRGLIRIDPGAQQTNSYLSDKMLMVGEKALANSIPSLQIEANDVKASHGSTTGQIDEGELFYLMSRGLTRSEAEHLIVQGFFAPVFERIKNEELKKKFEEALSSAEIKDK